MNFIHFNALYDVEVDFFYESMFFKRGITFEKLMVSSRFIICIAAISISLAWNDTLRTYYYS